MPSSTRIAGAVLAVTLASLLLVASAPGVHSQEELVRTQPPALSPYSVSSDGTVFTFTTSAQLSFRDTDNKIDIYQWSGGVTKPVSTSPSDTGTFDAVPVAVSEDGLRVIFETFESLTPDDSEAFRSLDVYLSVRNVKTRLLSKGPLGGNGAFDAFFAGTTPRAGRVFFRSREHLIAGDEDSCPGEPEPLPCEDLYERSSGTTSLVSTGPNEPVAEDGGVDSFSGASANGKRVFFRTGEALVAADGDGPPGGIGKLDIYERSGGQTTLVSTSGSNPNQPFDASFGRASADGTRVFIRTQEQLTGDDTDGGFDIFERSGGQTTRISKGALDSNTGAHAIFAGMTPDGAHVFFGTPERLESEDTDAQGGDLYRRSGAQTTLISTGPLPVSAASDLRATSDDGQRVVFGSVGKFTADDIDSQYDLYERFAAVTTRLSPGNGDHSFDTPVFRAASAPDATRVLFETREPILASDTDNLTDLYERLNGQFYLLSNDPGRVVTQYRGASRDGGSVYFEKSPLSMSTPAWGIYLARVAP